MNDPPPQLDQFSLETLFLLTTLVAVHCGIVVAQPCLGVFTLLIGIPALLRAIAATRIQLRAGSPVVLADKVLAYVVSLMISVAALSAAAVILFAGLGLAYWCLVTLEQSREICWIAGLALATTAPLAFAGAFSGSGAALYFIYWATLPRPKSRGD